MAEQPNEDIDGGDGATHAGAFHIGENGTDNVQAVRGSGVGEDEEEAIVGEGVVAEIWGKRGAKLEES